MMFRGHSAIEGSAVLQGRLLQGAGAPAAYPDPRAPPRPRAERPGAPGPPRPRPVHRIAHGVPDGRALLAGRHDVLGAQDGELLRHGGLVEVEEGLELLDARLAGAEELEDPDTQRVRQRLEEVGLEGLQIPRWRCAHGTSLYQSIAIY